MLYLCVFPPGLGGWCSCKLWGQQYSCVLEISGVWWRMGKISLGEHSCLIVLSLISLRSLPHTSCVYFLVGLIPSSPRACLHTAAEGSSQTVEEIALLACLSYLISTPKFLPSFNPCGVDSLRASRKPHPLVPPKASHPEVQGLISLEHGVGKQCKPVHAVDSALLLLLLSLLSDVSLLTRLLLR